MGNFALRTSNFAKPNTKPKYHWKQTRINTNVREQSALFSSTSSCIAVCVGPSISCCCCVRAQHTLITCKWSSCAAATTPPCVRRKFSNHSASLSCARSQFREIACANVELNASVPAQAGKRVLLCIRVFSRCRPICAVGRSECIHMLVYCSWKWHASGVIQTQLVHYAWEACGRRYVVRRTCENADAKCVCVFVFGLTVKRTTDGDIHSISHAVCRPYLRLLCWHCESVIDRLWMYSERS